MWVGDQLFEALGVDAVTEAVYRTVLEHPEPTDELLEMAVGCSPERAAEALRELEKLGLVQIPAGGGGPTAVSPERAVELLVGRAEADLEESRKRLEAARASIPELVDSFVDSRRRYLDQGVELLEDVTLVRSRLYQVSIEAERSVWALQPDLGLSPEAMTAARPLDRALRERGVDCRLVVTAASLPTPGWLDYLNELQQIGQQVRVAGTLTQRCILVDGTTAVIPSSAVGSPGAYVLHGEALVAPVRALIEETWLRAELLPASDAELGPEPADRVQEVATLLAAGLKDEAVARRLGVSIRTMRRLVATTLTALQADSRFQAGVHAERQGWLTREPATPRTVARSG